MHILNDQQYDAAREVFRAKMLNAADSAMRHIFIEHFGGMDSTLYGKAGARDADLPELFKALDAQFDRNLEHCGVVTPADLDKAEQRFASQ